MLVAVDLRPRPDVASTPSKKGPSGLCTEHCLILMRPENWLALCAGVRNDDRIDEEPAHGDWYVSSGVDMSSDLATYLVAVVMTDALTEHAEFPLGRGRSRVCWRGQNAWWKAWAAKSLSGFPSIGQDHLLYKATCRSHKHKQNGPKRRSP
jgi:hypothetical protein